MGKGIFCAAAILLCASAVANAQAIDGSITSGEYGPALVSQVTTTDFGNNYNELDALYAKFNPMTGSLSVGLTGNLQGNGNGLVLFIDSKAGGAVAGTDSNGYGIIGSIPGRYTDDWGTDTDGGFGVNTPFGGPSKLPVGFNPDYAIAVNSNDGFNYYTNIIDLSLQNDGVDDDNRDRYLGANVFSAGSATQDYTRDFGATTVGSITHAFDNSNVLGVNGTSEPLGDPLSAVTGYEAQLPASFLQYASNEVKLMAFITNASGDYLSNQILPGLPEPYNLGGPGYPGGDSLFDASLIGASFATVTVPEPTTLMGFAAVSLLTLARRRYA